MPHAYATDPTIASVTIGPMPRPMPQGMHDPMPHVRAALTDGAQVDLFWFYPDELTFSAQEFLGRTVAEARTLKVQKDRMYLMSRTEVAHGR